MIDGCVAILRSPKYITTMVKLVLSRTNLFGQRSISSCMKILHFWLLALKLRHTNLPADFDYLFFVRALRQILISDLCRNVLNGLWFIFHEITSALASSCGVNGQDGVQRKKVLRKLIR
jgi:hypothetical protein